MAFIQSYEMYPSLRDRGYLVVMEIIWWTKVWSMHPHNDRMFTVALDSCEDINWRLLWHCKS